MKASLVLAVLLAGSGLGVCGQEAAQKPLDPVLVKASNFVGGVWHGELKAPDGSPMILEFRYSWNPDRRGIREEGVIGKGRKDAIHTFVMFGWDPIAKKVYYLDTHNSETTYYGHVQLDGDWFVFEFGPAGGDMKQYSSRGKFTDPDTYAFHIGTSKDGKDIEGITLKRTR